MIQRANAAYKKTERLPDERIVRNVGSGLVAGWSRSTQHATIR